MKINYFLCVTEYHILMSILLAIEEFNTKDYRNVVVLCNSGRFNNKNYDLSQIGNVEYRVYPQEHINSSHFIEEVCNNCTGGLFLFNLNNPHFLYMCFKLKLSGQATTSFVQEGLASYNYRHFSLKQRIGLLKNNLSIIWNAGIRDVGFYINFFGVKGCFGRMFEYYDKAIDSPLVDCFWLSFPQDANYGKNKLKQIPRFSKKSRDVANVFFNYQDFTSLRTNDIIFIDQEIEGSFDFISALSQKFVDSNIYVKLHPKTPKEWAIEFERNQNVHVIKSLEGVPIELFLQNIIHVVVLTPFSSALLMNNCDCRYYYTYKWFINNGFNIGAKTLMTPGQHIKCIESINQIELY